jgi:hypothetical protein
MADDFEVGGPLPEESTNRPFVIAAAVLGGIMLLSIVCLGLYALVLAPRQRAARATEAANIILQNTQVVLGMTETGRAGAQLHATAHPASAPLQHPDCDAGRGAADRDAHFHERAAVDFRPAHSDGRRSGDDQRTCGDGQPDSTATALPQPASPMMGVPSLILLGGGLVVVVFLARRLRTRASP